MYEECSVLDIARKNSRDNNLWPQKAQRAIDKMQQVGNSEKCSMMKWEDSIKIKVAVLSKMKMTIFSWTLSQDKVKLIFEAKYRERILEVEGHYWRTV